MPPLRLVKLAPDPGGVAQLTFRLLLDQLPEPDDRLDRQEREPHWQR
jgi:hypothetical protein